MLAQVREQRGGGDVADAEGGGSGRKAVVVGREKHAHVPVGFAQEACLVDEDVIGTMFHVVAASTRIDDLDIAGRVRLRALRTIEDYDDAAVVRVGEQLDDVGYKPVARLGWRSAVILRPAVAGLQCVERVVSVNQEYERNLAFKCASQNVLRVCGVAVFKAGSAAFGVKRGITVPYALFYAGLCLGRDDFKVEKPVGRVLQVWKLVVCGCVDGAQKRLFGTCRQDGFVIWI